MRHATHITLSLALALALTLATGSALTARGQGAVLAVPHAGNQTPAAASLGSFVAVAWSAQRAPGATDIYVAVSRDAGVSFGGGVRVNAVPSEARVGGELPPRVGLVPRADAADPEIVVAYGSKTEHTEIKVSRSVDGGRTFSPGRPLQAAGAPGDRGWHAMALDASGTAHVMWLDHRGLASQGTASHAAHEAAALDGVAMARKSGLYYARDTGGTAPHERELLSGVCYCCKVALATAPGGAVFAAWRHVYPGNIRDIAFIASRDGGRTFGAQGRVSTDGWELAGCPDDGPAMAVDLDGTVHVVWPTVLAGPTPEGAIFYASSRDGRTFTARRRIPTLGSPRPMHPQIAVDGSGGIVVAWDEVLSGRRRAAARTIRFDEAGQLVFGAPEHLGSDDTPSFYPVLVATPRGVLAIYVTGAQGSTVIRTSPL